MNKYLTFAAMLLAAAATAKGIFDSNISVTLLGNAVCLLAIIRRMNS